jgi:hypothetical protein
MKRSAALFPIALALGAIDERRSGRAHGNWKNADDQTAVLSLNNAYLAAKSPWLQRRFHTPVELPFVVGRRPSPGEGPPLW